MTLEPTLFGELGIALAVGTVVFTLVAVPVTVAGVWKAFEKAGEPGWAALVPFYNLWVLCRIGHCATFWFWLSFVPVLNWFALARINVGVADQFVDRGVPFGLAMLVAPWLCWPLLGFAGFEYRVGFDAPTWDESADPA
ncbi:DUF5684 domain-containing protein [Halobacterium litoreum]|uniref:DUF5684 domain-containing protein n=1 Tax=Halobacterium litoreum TaxID=2039234 RepID=A0ABD5NBV7_9EURY|nr:DUF5684 domain-containing protein [Halobacterium litoreum]UHH14348.1 DUF5684 domain-containing protein [Halobacterium litoreum]